MKTIHCLLTGLLILSTTVAFAQSRFGISVTAAPAYAHATTMQTLYFPAAYIPSAPAGSTDAVPVAFASKTTAWGYVMGGTLHYQFSSSLSALVGLWYSQLSTTNFSIATAAVISIPTRTSSHGFQIPLFINYRLTNKRLSPYFSVGGLASFRQHTRLQYEPSSGMGDINVLTGKSVVTYQTVLGAGISYRFNPHLSLIAQPMLIWNFKPNGSYSQYTSYQINGQTQLVYSF